jgi:hypothetical protein
MRRHHVALLVIMLGLLPPLNGGKAADSPAALVESVSPPVPGVEEMAYLQAGATIKLPTGSTLELDYLNSCVHEKITATQPAGGTVQIGSGQSQVAASKVSRSRTDCDAHGLLQLAASESDVGGAPVWRGLPGEKLPSPDVTLRGTVPFIVSPLAGTLRIEQLGATAPPIEATIAAPAGAARASLDLASLHVSLQPGATYRITVGPRSRIFLVANTATADAALVDRLLPL